MNLILPRRAWVVASIISVGSSSIFTADQSSSASTATTTSTAPLAIHYHRRKLRGDNVSPEQILQRGHSHNDYEQLHPLDSALEHRLRSVEVDVFPDRGGQKLLVAHTRFELDKDKTIDNMYIQPILNRIRRHVLKTHKRNQPLNDISTSSSSTFHPSKTIQSAFVTKPIKNNDKVQSMNSMLDLNDGSLLLLVDFKADPTQSSKLLKKALAPLKPYLSKVDSNGKFIKGLVTVLISGNRPKEDCLYDDSHQDDYRDAGIVSVPSSSITPKRYHTPSLFQPVQHFYYSSSISPKRNDDGVIRKDRYLFIDGRISDLQNNTPSSTVPLISLNWNTVRLAGLFGRSTHDYGATSMINHHAYGGSDGSEHFMREMVQMAHSQGKKLRIWGSPNSQNVWRSMMRSGVDLLSIDDHDKFMDFANYGVW